MEMGGHSRHAEATQHSAQGRTGRELQAGRWGKPGEGGLDFGGPSRPEAGFGWLE